MNNNSSHPPRPPRATRDTPDHHAPTTEHHPNEPPSVLVATGLPSNKNPNFVRDYFHASRLHFIGSFRARYESMMRAIGRRLSIHPSILLKMPDKSTAAERIIVHIDMDCFFASVAIVNNPALRGKCIAVCHGGGEISSCSYEARAYGVRAGMFAKNAKKKCPHLQSVPYDFDSYEKISIQIYSFFYSIPHVCVEAVSVDEAYLDLTNMAGDSQGNTVEGVVSDLRLKIFKETGCTASAGIGPSKLIARLATKVAKPNGQKRVWSEQVISFLDTLSVKDMPGVGWKTSKKMYHLGIETIPDLRAKPLEELKVKFGEASGKLLYEVARGNDGRPVRPMQTRKSIGAEASWGIRFEQGEDDKVQKFIYDMADEVADRVASAGAYARRAVFKVYKKIPGSDMLGWKHLGHGPCTTQSKTLFENKRLAGNALRKALKDGCMLYYRKWGVRNDSFRGMALQAGRLVYADLDDDSRVVATNGSKRIDSFFKAVAKKNKVAEAKSTNEIEKLSKVSSKKRETEAPSEDTKLPRHVTSDEIEPILPREKQNKELGAGGIERVETQYEADKVQVILIDQSTNGDVIVKEDGKHNEMNCTDSDGGSIEILHAETEISKMKLTAPPGCDPEWFNSLTLEIKQEVILNHELAMKVHGAAELNVAHQETDTERNENENAQEQQHKRKRSVSGANGGIGERRKRRRAAQVTMTQFDKVARVRKSGFGMVHAEEFRRKSVPDALEFINDLVAAGVKGENIQAVAPGIRNGDGDRDVQVPSPPSLSSSGNSDDGGGIESVLQRHGNNQDTIYEIDESDEEKGVEEANSVGDWMRMTGGDVKTGEVELLRSRLIELVRKKQLKKVRELVLLMRQNARKEDMGKWGYWSDVIVKDVQTEVKEIYGLQLYLD